MNLLERIRRIRSLPRLALAIVVLATLQIAFVRCAMSEGIASVPIMTNAMSMDAHCAYCPPAKSDGICNFPHASIEAVSNPQGQSVLMPWDAPSLPMLAVTLRELRYAPLKLPYAYSSPPLSRRLNLTNCVQLK